MIFKLFGELVFVDFKGFYRTRYRSELGGFLGFWVVLREEWEELFWGGIFCSVSKVTL